MFNALVDVTSADLRDCSASAGVSDEWHVDLEEIVIVGEIGSYPASPESKMREI
jgi:hypothetical protein